MNDYSCLRHHCAQETQNDEDPSTATCLSCIED